MNEETHKTNEENLRTEYSALTSYGNMVVSFRFTLVGFYLAAIGLIATGCPSKEKAILLVWLSIVLWFLELRNRGLLFNLSERGVQIERTYWGYRGPRAYEPFISHQNKVKPKDDPKAGDPPDPDPTRILFWQLKIPVSHIVALDLLYLGIIVYAVVQLFTL